MSSGGLARRALGSTGLLVTPLCIGTSALGGMPHLYGYDVDEERARQTLREALGGPVNFLDTSNGYAEGRSEERVGEVLRELGGLPEGYVLATKVDPARHGERLDFSGARTHASVAESRRRLGIEQIQLLYLHDPERISFEEAMAADGPVPALLEVRDAGLAAHLGVAGGPVELLRRFAATGLFEVVITHSRYTLLDRSALPLLEDCAGSGVAVVNAAPFGGGMLSRGPQAQPRYGYRATPDAVVERAAAMEAACGRHGVPLAVAALQFSLRQPLVASTVVGVTRPGRIAETIAHSEIEIPGELWSELDALALPEELCLR
ncbi:MAG TPA: aldo/keto reductase [Acidimicrobiales bacterium]|nr:aldo/keto reductase [Acidimicrobiales bacterium]